MGKIMKIVAGELDKARSVGLPTLRGPTLQGPLNVLPLPSWQNQNLDDNYNKNYHYYINHYEYHFFEL